MTKHEVVFVDGIEDDFIEEGLSDTEILAVKNKLIKISEHQNPSLLTERVLNTPLRKMPYKNFRVFLHINDETLYCLAIRHHNRCYKTQEIRKILTVLEKISNK